MVKSPAKAISGWEQLNRDPQFVLRRTKAIDTALGNALSETTRVKSQSSVQFVRKRRDIQLRSLENYCERLYSIAKQVWKSRGRNVSGEFFNSVLHEGILPQLDKTVLYMAMQMDADGSQAFEALDNETFKVIDRETDWLLYELQNRLTLNVDIDAADFAPLPSPGMEDVRYALNRGERKEAVKLWLKINNPATKAKLYKAAKVDKSDYYKWERGELKDSSSADKALRRVLTG